ncbi:MAG: PBP1A family penicillin-binding protein [Desulfobulbaceae bacterium]
MPPRKKTSEKKPRKRAVRRKPLDHLHVIRFLLIICGTVTFLIGTGLAWFFSLDIPDIRSIDDYQPQVAVTLLDRQGRMIDAAGEQFRIKLRYEEMNPLLPMAFVAAEDSRYWDHAGLDTWSIIRAFINNLRAGRRSQGGSTITQQVTRALMLSPEKTYARKIREAVLAYRLDKLLTKEEILSIYLNEIYLGEGAYGVEAAARTYFGKPAARLDLAEIALLAGLPQSPSRYSPFGHLDRAKARQRYVLNRMAEEDYITPEQARQAFHRELRLQQPGRRKEVYGYFSDFVLTELENRFGRDEVHRKGMVVTTTLDSDLQAKATEALRRGTERIGKEWKSSPPQGALVVLDPRTGDILAMAGGTGYRESPFNRAVTAKRQPGSVFKPLLYAAALESGIPLTLTLDDAPFTIRNPDGTTWSPRNWDNRFLGPTTLAEGLVQSRNVIAVRLLQKTGVKPVAALAREAGIRSPLQPDLTLALGSSPVSLLEMTGSYTIFANSGVFSPPRAILRVRGGRGGPLPWPVPRKKQVITPATADRISDLLTEVIRRGTGKAARGIPGSGGKTGTTDDFRDAWFIGYARNLLAGVWVGHDRNETLGRGAAGGRVAAPIWLEFMRAAGETATGG